MKHNINLKWPYSVEIKQQHWVEQGHINELDLGNKQDCMLVLQVTPFAERVWSRCNHPQQKLDVANQIRALHRSHPLSWGTITSRV